LYARASAHQTASGLGETPGADPGSRSGFTLLELLTVVAIVVVLAD